MGKCEKSVKIVPPQNYHVTLKFLGSTPAEKIPLIRASMEAAAQKCAPFDLSLAGWGVFPEKGHPKVFWVAVEPYESLKDLFEKCETALESCGFPKETRSFQNHITVARDGNDRVPQDFLAQWKTAPLPTQLNFRADHITLYESITGGKASVYRAVDSVKII